MRLSEILYIFTLVPCMGSGGALGCTVLKSVLNVHLVTGLVQSYLEKTIPLKEGERIEISSVSPVQMQVINVPL